MNDYWVGGGPNEEDIQILSPAIKGYEGLSAPFTPIGKCTFLTRDDLCELHDLGLKPLEGRLAICPAKGKAPPPQTVHEDVAMKWNNPKAQKLVIKWNKSKDF
jgi:hypothetical protein